MNDELERFKRDLLKSVKQMRRGEAARCFGADIAGLGAGAPRADRSREDVAAGRVRTSGSAFEVRALMHNKLLHRTLSANVEQPIFRRRGADLQVNGAYDE